VAEFEPHGLAGTEPGERGSDSPVIRVLHVVMSLDAGGMERVLIRVARELGPRGFGISVCGLERRGALAESFPAPERVVTLGKAPGRSFGAIWRLRCLIRRARPDLIHTHNLGPLIYTVAATAGGVLRPILHGEHCQLLGQGLRAPRLKLRGLLYRFCRQIHTVSDESRRELLGLGVPAARVVAVVNGVDTVAFAPGDRTAARQRLGLPAGGQVVAMSARFDRRKRHHLLIEAVSRLVAQGRNLTLLLAGDGALRPDLEALARTCGVEPHVCFLGYREDIQTVYQAADLVVLPSTGEGLSNALLEAMACATPVLCHAACGCAEAVSDGADGWVRNIDSGETLAGFIGTLLGRPEEIRSMGVAARQKMISRFAFQQAVTGYERLYRDMVYPR
jgi:glycosyltransferase involved in cell wall biosynthesis